jgi:hypothetical protein
MNNISWYEMYKNSETYSKNGIVSEMIWGCQWDAMMIFIGSQAKEITQELHEFSSLYKTGEKQDVVVDRLKNIYDLKGNVSEWTQEAYTTYIRISRGGNYCNEGSASMRGNYFPSNANKLWGTRLALYIE